MSYPRTSFDPSRPVYDPRSEAETKFVSTVPSMNTPFPNQPGPAFFPLGAPTVLFRQGQTVEPQQEEVVVVSPAIPAGTIQISPKQVS